MLFDDDIVTDGEAKPCPFSRWFGCEERVEHLVLHLRRNTDAVVTYSDLNPIAEIFGDSSEGRFVTFFAGLVFAFRRGIKAVRYQVQQNARDFLWKQIDFAGRRIERPVQGDVETLLFGAGAVIGEIESSPRRRR